MSATKVTPSATTEVRKRTRRLSFADEYDGGKLESTVLCTNLHYSKDPQPKGGGSGGNKGGDGDGDGGGCCVISWEKNKKKRKKDNLIGKVTVKKSEQEKIQTSVSKI